jgi:hypothetical protein
MTGNINNGRRIDIEAAQGPAGLVEHNGTISLSYVPKPGVAPLTVGSAIPLDDGTLRVLTVAKSKVKIGGKTLALLTLEKVEPA